MIALDVIKGAFRVMGILHEGQGLGADDIAGAVIELNSLLDDCNTERLNIFHIQRITFPLVVGQQTYTIGTGGNINQPRPPKIERAGFMKMGDGSSPIEMPMEMLTASGWAAEQTKAVPSTLADKLYYEPAAPLGLINIWPKPASTDTVALYVWAVLLQVADETVTLNLPYGYQDFLRYQLAIRMWPEKKPMAPIRQDVWDERERTKLYIQGLNAQFLDVPVQQAPPPPTGKTQNAPTPETDTTKGQG